MFLGPAIWIDGFANLDIFQFEIGKQSTFPAKASLHILSIVLLTSLAYNAKLHTCQLFINLPLFSCSHTASKPPTPRPQAGLGFTVLTIVGLLLLGHYSTAMERPLNIWTRGEAGIISQEPCPKLLTHGAPLAPGSPRMSYPFPWENSFQFIFFVFLEISFLPALLKRVIQRSRIAYISYKLFSYKLTTKEHKTCFVPPAITLTTNSFWFQSYFHYPLCVLKIFYIRYFTLYISLSVFRCNCVFWVRPRNHLVRQHSQQLLQVTSLFSPSNKPPSHQHHHFCCCCLCCCCCCYFDRPKNSQTPS